MRVGESLVVKSNTKTPLILCSLKTVKCELAVLPNLLAKCDLAVLPNLLAKCLLYFILAKCDLASSSWAVIGSRIKVTCILSNVQPIKVLHANLQYRLYVKGKIGNKNSN